MQIINLLAFLYSKHQKMGKNGKVLEKEKWRNIMRGKMRELSQIARMNLIMGSTQWTPMSWSIEDKVGVVI